MNAYDIMNEIKNCEVLKKELNGILQDLLEDGQVTATPFVKEQLTLAIVKIGKYNNMMEDLLRHTEIQ